MNMIDNFRFLTPSWLLLMPIGWWLAWLYSRARQKQSSWSLSCEPRLLPLLLPAQSDHRSKHGLTVLLALVFSIGAIALAGPSWQTQRSPTVESAAARVFIVDLSRSMLVEDLKPNRLNLVINSLQKLVRSEFVGETGLVVFSGASFVVAPLTEDANTLLEFSEALHPDTMPVDGGRLDLAITSASGLLMSSITRKGNIIILTDGLNQVDDPVSTDGTNNFETALDSASIASNHNHRISVLAFGSAQGAPMRDARGRLIRNQQGGFKLAKTNFIQLEEIARIGRGQFARIESLDPGLESLISKLDTPGRQGGAASNSKIGDDSDDPAFENSGVLIVWLMLPIALILFRKNLLWLVLIAVMAPVDNQLYAMDLKGLWRNAEQRAFSAYQQGNYQQVIRLSVNPSLLGSALFESKDFSAAYEVFSQQGDSAQSFYNRANALAFQQKFEKALIAYDQALSLQPKYEDARINKQLIQAYLAKQENSNGQGNEFSDETLEGLANENLQQPMIGQSEAIDGSRSDSDQSGLGAGSQYLPGKIIKDDNFDGFELTLDQLTLRLQDPDYAADAEQLKLWTKSLTHNPVELFRRKFLRDYQQTKNQSKTR